MNYIPENRTNQPSDTAAFWFLFYDNQILMETDNTGCRLPAMQRKELTLRTVTEQYLGTLNGTPCYCAVLTGNQNIPSRFGFLRVRDLYGKLDEDLFWLAARAFHISTWDLRTQYCGVCGTANANWEESRAKICPKCGQLNFPRISPAIIVAIIKDRQILLARNRNLAANLYTVIAGFVEPGETLEECLQREVREEVGIAVRNIQYFTSQPWPFPDSLMIAFTAEYAGGDIRVDGQEIIEAKWFSAAELPLIPGKVSVARKLIDWFADNYK